MTKRLSFPGETTLQQHCIRQFIGKNWNGKKRIYFKKKEEKKITIRCAKDLSKLFFYSFPFIIGIGQRKFLPSSAGFIKYGRKVNKHFILKTNLSMCAHLRLKRKLPVCAFESKYTSMRVLVKSIYLCYYDI